MSLTNFDMLVPSHMLRTIFFVLILLIPLQIARGSFIALGIQEMMLRALPYCHLGHIRSITIYHGLIVVMAFKFLNISCTDDN